MISLLDFLALLNVLIAITASMIGIILIANSHRDPQRTSFSLLCISMAIWIIANFFGSNSLGAISYILILTDYLTGVIMMVLFWVFSYQTKRRITHNRSAKNNNKTLIFLSVWVVTLSALIIAGQIVDIQTQPKLHIENQMLYALYPLTIGVMAVASLRNLISAQRNSYDKKYTKQIRSIYAALLIAFLLISIPNLILSNILEKDFLLVISYNFSYLGVLAFVFITAYAVFRQGFLDVRYIVFRLIGYITALAILLIVFISITDMFIKILNSLGLFKENDRVLYITIAGLMAIFFNPMKRGIDRATNKIFFQDRYSLHAALDRMSTFATRNVNSEGIENQALEVFNTTIRPEFATFLIFNSNGKLQLAAHTGEVPIKIVSSKDFLDRVARLKQKSTIPEDTTYDSAMRNYFDSGRISVITKLTAFNKSIGYIIAGDKMNGRNYDGHDLQLLTLASDNLALALQNAQRYEEIQAFNETLQNKVNEATKALRRTNKKLIALDDAKDEFISMASHQLRTPLTSVKGYISMLLEEDLGKINDKQRQALKEAFDSSQRMVFLISDFLNVSRMRTGRFMIDKSPTDLNAIVTEEVAQLKEMAALREQEIILKTSKTLPTIMLDDNKIRQVMMNMLDNAIFYTPRGGRITVKLEASKDEISYQVIDEGIGVPAADQHRLFTKFFRAPNAQRARPDGTGLGLFMAQKIITAQGGSVIFSSVEGKGSTFGFRFPLDAVKTTIDK